MPTEITDSSGNYSFTSRTYFCALGKRAETPKGVYRAIPSGIEEC